MLKNIITYIHKNFAPLSVSIICMYALYLRIMFLYRHTLWVDELYELKQMAGTFLELLKELPKMGFCSYLFGDAYLFFPFFKIFSYNKWGLAIPCIIATIIGFHILYLICKRYFKSPWAYIITFGIVCFNVTLINHATEIRAYAFLPTLALGTFYLFQKIGDLDFRINTPKRIGSVIFFVAVIWFHVYGILMFTSSFLFTLLAKNKEIGFKIYFKNALYLAALVLCFAMPLWLYSVFGPHFVSVQDPFEYIPSPSHNIMGFLKGIFCNLIGHQKFYFLFLGLIIPFIFVYQDRYKQLLFLFFSIIIPICFILFFDIAGKYWFLQRQFIWVIPFFAIFLGWTWDSFFILLKNKFSSKKGN